MVGTKAGAVKTAATNKRIHGEDFYVRIGRKGGSVIGGKPKGFALDRERASWAGKKGGAASKRGPAKNKKVGGDESQEN